jgi:hypothetical protein
MGKEPSSYDDTAVTDWATAVLYAVALLVSAKNQYTILKLQPKYDRSDSSDQKPFVRTTLKVLMSNLYDIYIPPVAYPLAEMFTRVIQLGGAEAMNSIPASYLVPTIQGLTASDFSDLLDAYEGLDKVGMFAGYINKPLVKIHRKWVETPHIIPFYTDWAQWVGENLPVENYDGSITEYSNAYDGDVNVWFNQALGVSSYIDAGALWRCADAGTAALFLSISNPSSGKLSFKYFDTRATATPTEYANTTTRLDFLKKVANARSSTQRGIFGHTSTQGDNFMQYHTVAGDETAWNRRLSNFIALKILDHKLPVKSLARLLPSIDKGLDRPGVKIATANQTKYGRG